MAFKNATTRISELIVDLLRTADPPNRRWEISTSVADMIEGFTGSSHETAPAKLAVVSSGGFPQFGRLRLISPSFDGTTPGEINTDSSVSGFTATRLIAQNNSLQVDSAQGVTTSLNTPVEFKGPVTADAGVESPTGYTVGGNPVPFATAAGSLTHSALAAGTGTTLAVTFPVGRFSVSPFMFANGWSNGFNAASGQASSASGGNVRNYNPQAAGHAGNEQLQWFAVQMLSGSAAG